MPAHRVPLHRVTSWPLWAVLPRLVVAVLGVELLAVVLVVADVVGWVPVTLPDGGTAALLCGAAVLHLEIVLRTERIRRGASPTHHVDLHSVWTFAAALVLPPSVASGCVVVIYVYLYVRLHRPTGIPAYKQVYNAATVLLAVHAAGVVLLLSAPGQVYAAIGGALAPVVALLAYTVVNTGLVLGAVATAGPDVRLRSILGSGDEVLLEVASLCLGALVAGALTATAWPAVLLVIPPVLVVHRTLVVRQLEQRADTDAKTGLLNASAWRARASRALRSAQRQDRRAGLLILDLDHFKAVNDRHGHLAGDEVLGVIAGALRAEVRDGDVVGRFGGEEFVILLARLADPADPDEVRRIGERVRVRVRELRVRVGGTANGPTDGLVDGLTVSVGGAVYPTDGADLTGLLEAADAALYAAKRAGRDTVRMSPAHAGDGDPLAC